MSVVPTSLCRRALLLWSLIGVPHGAARAQAGSGVAEVVAPPALSLVVLGSGGPAAVGRAGACYVLLLDGVPRILLDAGPGAFVRLGEARLPLAKLDTVLLTHLHADHVGGLPGLVKARAVSAGGPANLQVFGPAGRAARQGSDGGAYFPSTRRFIELLFGPQGAFAYLSEFSAPLHFSAHDVPARSRDPITLLSRDGLQIRAVAGHHLDAPSVIYRVDYQGRSITFSGDIDPAGHEALWRLAQGSQWLVFNSVVLDPPGSPDILYTLHTTPRDIGRLADVAGVGQLLLSHLNPTIDRHESEVRASIAEHFKGPVRMAHDGLVLSL